MKILHIINGEFYSGAERVQDLLAQRLPAYGYEVTFACLKPKKFPVYCKCRPEKVLMFPMHSKFDLTQAGRVARQVLENNFKLIHTHTPRSALIGRFVSSLSRVPMVHHIHGRTDLDTEHGFRNRVNVFVEQMTLTGVRRLITVSESLKKYMIDRGYRAGRIAVVPNGVPTPTSLIERTVPKNIWSIGTVALFRPRKGLEILLKALIQLDREDLRFRLRAVGAFETRDFEFKVKKLANELGLTQCIDWLGFTNDVYAELARMDVFILPSLYGEGMPMVILEAMAAGVPVIATKVEGVPEVIRDREEGLIVTPGDASELAKALKLIITGRVDWCTMREKAYRRHLESFSDICMAQNVAQIYDQLLLQ